MQSAKDTAADFSEIEFIVYLDDDDMSYNHKWFGPNVNFIVGPRVVLSEMWNRCQEEAVGPIYMHCGDDIIFRTPNWDRYVKEAFDESADKILLIHGRDGIHDEAFGTHCFIHKNWVDAVGYFVPPYFSSDYNDTWLNDVANALDRRLFLPFYTEHMHFVNGKALLDRTHQERLDRGVTDGVDAMYHRLDMVQKRQEDIEKLRRVMK